MTFVGDFVSYCRSRTEAPRDFHVGGALATVALALGNRVSCDGRGRDVYPNVWIVNIGPSGIGKSIPQDVSRRVLERAGLGGHLLSESFSQEALYDELKEQPVRMFNIQEFSAFLAGLQREYNQGAVAWLTEMFDVPDVFRRKLRANAVRKDTGLIELEKPCITILAATAPEWFAETFRQANLRSGFYVRILYCPREEREDYVPDPGPVDEAREVALADHLRRLGDLSGKARFGRVMRSFDAWEEQQRRGLSSVHPDFAGMRSRAGLMVKKMAMLFHASENPTDLEITEADLKRAIAYVQRTHDEAERFLSERVAHSRDDAQRLRVLEIVERAGGEVDRSKVLRDGHMSARDYEQAVKTLEMAGRIQREMRRGDGARRASEWLMVVRSPNGVHR